MSVKVMGLVWDMDLPRDEKLVLLAYADHADHDGGSVYPGIESIAKKTGYSERSTQRITRKLEKKGLLIPTGGQAGGRGITPHWRIPTKGDKLAPFIKGDKRSTKRVTKSTEKGDTAMSPDPSLTIKEPSVPEHKKMFGALAGVTGLDPVLSRTKIGTFGSRLSKAGYLSSQVECLYGAGGWWYTTDWRGKKGEVPTLEIIHETIKRAVEESTPRKPADLPSKIKLPGGEVVEA